MPKFRKKPVVIEAFEYKTNEKRDWPVWFQKAHEVAAVQRITDANGLEYLTISTLEGLMIANFSDYIIQGVKGEIYPCKADIFAATYEAVDD